MCIYTARKYTCWCGDYYIKPLNHCPLSLSNGKPCPKPLDTSKLEKEYCGTCDYHLKEQEAVLQAQGIPNPAYTDTQAQAEVGVREARYSSTTTKSLPIIPEGRNGDVGEARGRGIRESKTFPLSPPSAQPARRSEPTLTNAFSIPKLLRSKTTAAQPLPSNPGPLHRSQTARVNPTNTPRAKEPQRSKTFSLLSPKSKSKQRAKAKGEGEYEPITAAVLTSPKINLSPLRGTKPVRTALRDSNGFFIDPAIFSLPLRPESVSSASQLGGQREEGKRDSASSYTRPSECVLSFQTGPSQFSDPFSEPPVKPLHRRAESDPFLDCNPETQSRTQEEKEREERRLSELERRRSNRSSYVYQRFEGPTVLEKRVERDREVDGGGGRFRESGVRRWVAGVVDEAEDGGEKRGCGDDEDGGLRMSRRKSGFEDRERRKSARRESRGVQVEESEEEVLYSGSEYQTEYSPQKGERAKYAETEETQEQKTLHEAQHSETPLMDKGKNATGKARVDEEEVIQSDGSYETDYRYSDEE